MRLRPLLSCLLLIGAMAATLARTLRGPNDWAEAHWLLDYRFGFVKRGLLGQLLGWACGDGVGERAIAIASFGAFALFVGGLSYVAWRILRRCQWHPAAVAAVAAFATSPFVVLTGHLVGYFEHVFLLLGIASIWLALRGRVLLGSLVQAAALFVHEACIVLVFPAFALACLLRAARTPAGERSPSMLPLLVPMVIAALFGRVIGAPPAGFRGQYAAWLGSHPFIENGYDAITAEQLTWSLTQFFETVWQFGIHRLMQPGSYGLVLPTIAVLLLLVLARRRIAACSFEAAALAFVMLVPQAMHLVAYDLERIFAFSIVTTWLAVWIYAETREHGADEVEAPGLFAVAVLTTFANCVVTTPLLDNEIDRYPGPWRFAFGLAMVVLLIALSWGALPAGERRWQLRGRSLVRLLLGRH